MNIKHTYLIVFLALAVPFSCGDVLDINKDPLAATKANPSAILPFVFAEYSARKTSELGLTLVDVVQHTSHIFNSIASGSVGSFTKGNTWRLFYNNVLANLRLVENDAKAAGKSNDNVQAVAKIMQAQVFFELTCIFDDIPYNEALDPIKFPFPQFDSQEKVLDGVVSTLDEAMALIDGLPEKDIFDLTQGDMLLGGDIKKWRAFANSIKIRTLMLIRNVSSRTSDANQKLVQAFKQPTVSFPVFLHYKGTSGAQNAYYHVVARYFGKSNEATQVLGPSRTLTNMLLANQDPRLKLWLVDLSGTGKYPTAELTKYPNNKEAVYADKLIRGSYPDIYILPGEISFYKAELILAGVLSGNAQDTFEKGVESTLKYWGGEIDGFEGNKLPQTEITAYIKRLGTVTPKKIYEQLWLESIFRPIVAWNTLRRTGVPALKPPGSTTIKTILKRFDYPTNEIAANPNIPPNKDTDIPVWFEKK